MVPLHKGYRSLAEFLSQMSKVAALLTAIYTTVLRQVACHQSLLIYCHEVTPFITTKAIWIASASASTYVGPSYFWPCTI